MNIIKVTVVGGGGGGGNISSLFSCSFTYY